LRKAVANEDVTFTEGKCLSYSRGVTYHPIIEVVKANFDIMEGDGDLEIREKLKRSLNILGVDEASTLPYLLELLSVKDSGINTISLSPEARKDKIFKALIRITIKASEIRPLIMAIEDLHWIDKSSEDYFKDLLDSISGARVFLIFTYRPEFVHTWGAKSYHSHVNLNRLSNRESLAMVSHLLDAAEIHRDFEDFILEKTEGVPFFIEEFIRSLKDLKVIERKDNQYLFAKDFLEMTIPSTIQDVIMARVDSLPEGAKEVIQTGSVIEREFSYELIKRLTGLPEQELLSCLSILKDTELLYERGIYPQSIYIFKHALTQEVVYDSILTRKKKKLHEDIGNAIEDLYKENIGEYYGVLAEHFIYSENYGKGAEYSKLAGKKAEKKASINDAISYAKKRVASLERLPRTDDLQKRIVDARTVLGLYYIQLNLMVEAKEAVGPIIDSATKLCYKRRLSQIYTIMGAYYSYEDDLPKAFEYLENALRTAEELNDIPSLAFANTFMGVARSYNCEFTKALHYTEKALEINVAGNVLWGIASMKTHLVLMYLGHGKVGLAYEKSAEILQIADENSDIYSKMQAYEALSHSCFYKGFFEEAKEHLPITSDLAERLNIFSIAGWASQLLGETYFAMGEYKKSQKYYEKAISFLQMGRILPSYINLSKMLISRAKVMNNEEDIDLHEILKWLEEDKIKLLEGHMLNCIGSILLNIDDQHMNEAEDLIKKAIEANYRNGMMWHLAQDYALYAEFYKRKNDLSKSRENLNKSIEIMKECGADGWVERYEKELALLS
ncbi:MAG: hypothetical protein JRJ02_14170, partial [Deltaproteobacteria bacterium]|nr:hypothetical protein [Deltaproteobacteria bacterium]